MIKHPSYGYAKPEEIRALRALDPTNVVKREEILKAISRRTVRIEKKAKTTLDGGQA